MRSCFDFSDPFSDDHLTQISDAFGLTIVLITISITGWFWGPMYTFMKLRQAKMEADAHKEQCERYKKQRERWYNER